MSKHFVLLLTALISMTVLLVPTDSLAQDKPKDATSFTEDAISSGIQTRMDL